MDLTLEMLHKKNDFEKKTYTPENKHGSPQNDGLDNMAPFDYGHVWYLR